MKDDQGPAYFNSTQVRGQVLVGYEIQAQAQNDKVLEFLENNPRAEVTSEDINDLVLPGAPETSPRRAMSWLRARGLVEKVGKIEGKYGRPIYVWRYRRPEPTQAELFA